MLQVIRLNFRCNQSRCVQNNLVNIDATRINNGEEPYCLMSQFVKLADSNLKSKKEWRRSWVQGRGTWERDCFLTKREREEEMARMPRPTASSLKSAMTTCMFAAAATCAMPDPIWPAPTTPTTLTVAIFLEFVTNILFQWAFTLVSPTTLRLLLLTPKLFELIDNILDSWSSNCCTINP